MTDTNRLETFADGVFAIAITLLVLGIAVPAADVPLGEALTGLWPAFLAYAVSFLTIGIAWANHHQLFTLIGRSNMTFAFINVVFLMVIAFLPFPTELVAERLASGVDAQLATLLYGATWTAIAVMFNVVWLYASGGGGRLLKPDIEDRVREVGARGYQYAPVGYLAVTLLAFISPLLSLAAILVYAIYWILPISGFISPKGSTDQ